MSGIILGGNSDKPADQEEDDRGGESRRVNVTNFLSLGHLTPWGGDLQIRKLSPSEIKERFKDKRVDLFVYPDLELMRELYEHEAMATGHMPQGDPSQREAAFCDMIESSIKQMTECHVRRAPKPKPAGNDRRTFYVQFFTQTGGIIGSLSLASIWWELVTKNLVEKPGAAPKVNA